MNTKVLLFFLLAISISEQAISADIVRGEQIATEMEKRTTGFKPFSVSATLLSVGKDGTETFPRALHIRVMDSTEKDAGYLTFIEVTAPARIRGMAYLTLSQMKGSNIQWRYDTARVRKIAIVDPKGSFLESEFSYEDLADQEVHKFSYAYLRDEPCGALTCFVLERMPRKESAYEKQVVWVDGAEYRVQKAELYGKAGIVVKTITVSGYQKVQDRFWWPDVVELKNAASGRVSRIRYAGYKVDTDVTQDVFNPSRMRENRAAGN